jgi:GNAT superfamily N-acetyltransferase
MRASEFITESVDASEFLPMPLRMSNYRGSYDPRTMEPYPAKYQDNSVLADRVDSMIAAGVEPQVTVVDPRSLRATQDWLSTEGGGDPLFPEYTDLPVVLKMPGEFGQLLVLDGHHRSSQALRKGQKIRVYLFDTDLKENAELGQRQHLDFDQIYGRYLKVTDNDGDPNKPGFSLVTPLNGASWNWRERPEFKKIVKQNLNQPGWLGDHKYQQIIDSMAGNKFDPAKHLSKLYKENVGGNKKIAFQVKKGRNKFATEMTVNGEPVGVYQYDANTGRSIAEIYPEYRSQGLGKILVLHAIYTAAKLGMDFQEDESRTSEYDNVLDSLSSNGYIVDDDGYWYVTGEGEQFLNNSLKENFADGRVKGKSRPGRVKRAGASCAGSVTDLRARAKKYSGERAKMYHWCANMKAGKKK